MLTGQDPQTHGMVGYRDGVEWEAPAPDVVRPRQVLSETALQGAAYVLIAPEQAHASLLPLVEAR